MIIIVTIKIKKKNEINNKKIMNKFFDNLSKIKCFIYTLTA